MTPINPNTLTPEELTRFAASLLESGQTLSPEWVYALVVALNKYTQAL